MPILMFAILGVTADAGALYWVAWFIYCLAQVVGSIREVYR